jgi:putative transcriptional regulator
MARAFTKGRLLVASPLLDDPNFERSVVLMLDHTDEGAVGLVLNRPSPIEIADALPDWLDATAEPPVVYVGGPVSRGSVIALARRVSPLPPSSWSPVIGQVGVLDLDQDPAGVTGCLDAVRVFTGYAGWGVDQLEDELRKEAWFVVESHPDDAFRANPVGLWRTVLRRQTQPLSYFATFPAVLAAN